MRHFKYEKYTDVTARNLWHFNRYSNLHIHHALKKIINKFAIKKNICEKHNKLWEHGIKLKKPKTSSTATFLLYELKMLLHILLIKHCNPCYITRIPRSVTYAPHIRFSILYSVNISNVLVLTTILYCGQQY